MKRACLLARGISGGAHIRPNSPRTFRPRLSSTAESFNLPAHATKSAQPRSSIRPNCRTPSYIFSSPNSSRIRTLTSTTTSRALKLSSVCLPNTPPSPSSTNTPNKSSPNTAFNFTCSGGFTPPSSDCLCTDGLLRPPARAGFDADASPPFERVGTKLRITHHLFLSSQN